MKSLFLVMLCFPLLTLASNRPVGKSFATRSEIFARNGAAATSHPLATQAALDLLKQGGNAIDAAIAANAMLGLVEPMSCGMGGDLFAIVWDARSQKLHGLNASGRSPASLTLAHFKQLNLDKIPKDGPLPISVPGCVDGWFELHKKFGKSPMNKILEPAIYYAREGFGVTEVIAEDWERSVEKMEKWPGFREIYLPEGQAPKKGDFFKNPALGRAMQLLADNGRDAFYRGEISRAITAFLKTHGGFLTEQDFGDHRSEWVEPVSTNYRGYDVWELPPNGQGIAVLQMLNLLEAYDLKSMGWGSAELLHHLVEAKKLAFEDRARFYADPSFNKIPVRELISKKYATERRRLLDPKKSAKIVEAGNPVLNQGDTIYLTVADREGNMVSLIQSNYRGFGSGMTPPSVGFVLQNRGEMFDLEPGHFNSYQPRKRPFHTIIPGFVTREGKPFLSFGVMGGAMQPQGHVQVLINLIDFEMNLQEAGDAPRAQHVDSSEPTGEKMKEGGQVYLEFGFAEESERDLMRKGHKVGKAAAGTFGGYQAILWDAKRGVYTAASESRKDGQAAGY